MNRRMKAGSWANLRAFSVNLRDKIDKVDLRDSYVDDKSNSFGSAEYAEPDFVWHEDLGAQKSFSFSTVAIQRARSTNSECHSGDHTPISKRRSSVKRIWGKLSSATAPPIPPGGNSDKNDVPRKKDKSSANRDSLYFNLYMEALEKGLLSLEELDIWNIQGRFPNDDLRFYEGLFSVKAEDMSSSALLSDLPSSLSLNQADDSSKSKVSVQDKQDLYYDAIDIPCSPAIPRKMVTARAVIHPITSFRYNQNRPPQPATISSQFPDFHRLSPALQTKFKKMAQRRQSAPSIVIRGVLGRSVKPSSSLHGRDDSSLPVSPNVNSQRLSLKFGNHFATLNLSKRKYVMEGKVQLTAGLQTLDRYMFLFTDLLLIAKAKSGSNFKLKYRIRVCELWTASCLDVVSELPKANDTSFVIGWPTTNFVATFSTPESKELWRSALLKKMHEEKEKESPQIVTLKIINRDSSNISHIKMLKVSHTDTASDVVRNAVKEFGFEETEDQYQLWVTSKKEGTAYPLIGHENPHAIHVNHVRDFISANGILPENDLTTVAKYENMIEPEIRDRCQFVLKNCRQTTKYNIDLIRRKPSRVKVATPSKSFFHWGRKKSGQRNESSDSGHVSGNSVGSEGTTFTPSSPPSTSPPATPKLFSLPLGQVCDNAELPTPIATMFDILYRKAPYTYGIFRKSPSTKICRQLRNKLNEEIDIDLEKESIHVIAALVKEFLRHIPDSVLECTMYDKWVGAIRNSSENEKLKSIRRLLFNLDACNRVLVRRLSIVLNRVASRSDRNKMTSHNLALCISPSLLWPLGPASQGDAPMKVTEVTDLLLYFIDHCDDIFEGVTPTDIEWPSKIESKSDNEEEYEGEEKLNVDESLSPVSDDAAAGRDFCEAQEKDENELTHFNRSRITRRQCPRRKTGSRIDASTRLISLSQDSLDKVLMDDNMNLAQQTLDDIVLNESEMSRTHYIRKRGNGFVSNDSGFTTLSGEEDSIRSTIKDSAEFHVSYSTGSNLNELVESFDERLEMSCNGLRRLWAPDLLNIENGQILDGMEMNGIREERIHNNYVGPDDTILLGLDNRSRPVHTIDFGDVDLDESDNDHITFVAKPPTYVRLNDVPSIEGLEIYKDTRPNLLEVTNTGRYGAEEAVERDMTSLRGKKVYKSGATLAVDDVRPPETTCFRPVTLSICGLGRTNNNEVTHPVTNKFRSVTTPTKTGPFYIEEEENLDSTPDVLSSSQEDVFNDWSTQRASSELSRERSTTDGEIFVGDAEDTSTTSNHDSITSRSDVKIDVTFIHSRDVENPPGQKFSIQKLTENLQQMPDFQNNSCRVKKHSKEPDSVFTRKKACSVREGRRLAASQSSMNVTHLPKATFKPQINDIDDHELDSRNDKAENLKISFNSKPPVNSSSQHSAVEMSVIAKNSWCDRGIRSRRGCGRRRISGNITKTADPNSFSKSLPTSNWNSLGSTAVTRDDSIRSVTSQSSTTSNSYVALNRHEEITGNEECIPKSTSTNRFSRRSDLKNVENVNHNSAQFTITTNNTFAVTTPQDSAVEKIRVRRKMGVAAPPAKIAPKSTQSDVNGEKNTALVVSTRSNHISSNMSSSGQKNSITVQVSTPAHYQTLQSQKQVPQTVSYQPVTDNLIFTLSESFAFGNRKSPRSMTPDPFSQENSKVSERDESQTQSHETQPTLTPDRRRRHHSVDRYIEPDSKPKINAHVTSVSVRRRGDNSAHKTPIKHLQPPKAPKIDKNANDLLPFIGIIQSEESYV